MFLEALCRAVPSVIRVRCVAVKLVRTVGPLAWLHFGKSGFLFFRPQCSHRRCFFGAMFVPVFSFGLGLSKFMELFATASRASVLSSNCPFPEDGIIFCLSYCSNGLTVELYIHLTIKRGNSAVIIVKRFVYGLLYYIV